MSKKQEGTETVIVVNKTEGLEEFSINLKKDEEALKQNMIAIQAQLQYNQIIQKSVQQLISKLNAV